MLKRTNEATRERKKKKPETSKEEKELDKNEIAGLCYPHAVLTIFNSFRVKALRSYQLS